MKKILIVDDSVVVRRKLVRLLTAPDTEVFEAPDGRDGLEMVASKTPDIILLDSNMPNVDGLGMLAQLRQTGNNTPVLLVTAEASSSVISSLVSLGGVVDYVMKPFNPESVRAQVRKTLGLPSAAPVPAPPVADALRIMVYGSNPDIITELQLIISQQTELYHCVDAGSAIATARKNVFKAIFIDVSTPDAEVEEAHSLLQELQPTADFIALIASSDNNGRQLAIEHGFHRTLGLPLEKAMVSGLLAKYATEFSEAEPENKNTKEREASEEAAAADQGSSIESNEEEIEYPSEEEAAETGKEVEESSEAQSGEELQPEPPETTEPQGDEQKPRAAGNYHPPSRESRYTCDEMVVMWKRPGLLTALTSQAKKGDLVDVGCNGMCLELREQLPKGKKINVELRVRGQSSISLEAEVRYSFLVEEKRWSVRYRTGLLLQDHPKQEGQLNNLRKYIEDNLNSSVHLKRKSVLIE